MYRIGWSSALDRRISFPYVDEPHYATQEGAEAAVLRHRSANSVFVVSEPNYALHRQTLVLVSFIDNDTAGDRPDA